MPIVRSQVGVHGQGRLQTAQNQRGDIKAAYQRSLVGGLQPVMGAQYSETDESRSSPNRITNLVQSDQPVNQKDRPDEG